jgi:hypothetical protein
VMQILGGEALFWLWGPVQRWGARVDDQREWHRPAEAGRQRLLGLNSHVLGPGQQVLVGYGEDGATIVPAHEPPTAQVRLGLP